MAQGTAKNGAGDKAASGNGTALGFTAQLFLATETFSTPMQKCARPMQKCASSPCLAGYAL